MSTSGPAAAQQATGGAEEDLSQRTRARTRRTDPLHLGQHVRATHAESLCCTSDFDHGSHL